MLNWTVLATFCFFRQASIVAASIFPADVSASFARAFSPPPPRWRVFEVAGP